MPLNDLSPFRTKTVSSKYTTTIEMTVNRALSGNLTNHIGMLVKEFSDEVRWGCWKAMGKDR
jgi:hypothetical protein